MKPIIGVMPLWDDEKESIWMLPGYLSGISEAGGTPVIFPLTRDEEAIKALVELCNGILFTGGQDVSPAIYHQEPLKDLTVCCAERDEMELCVLQAAMEEDKSMLGICRGLQFINAALGGTLYQDIPLQHPSDIEHHQDPPYDKPVHEVNLRNKTPLHECLGIETLPVNSYHHQAVKELAPCLESMAESTDGLTEAAYMPGRRFLWAVQWHPEFLYETDDNSRKIFRAFVGSMIAE